MCERSTEQLVAALAQAGEELCAARKEAEETKARCQGELVPSPQESLNQQPPEAGMDSFRLSRLLTETLEREAEEAKLQQARNAFKLQQGLKEVAEAKAAVHRLKDQLSTSEAARIIAKAAAAVAEERAVAAEEREAQLLTLINDLAQEVEKLEELMQAKKRRSEAGPRVSLGAETPFRKARRGPKSTSGHTADA